MYNTYLLFGLCAFLVIGSPDSVILSIPGYEGLIQRWVIGHLGLGYAVRLQMASMIGERLVIQQVGLNFRLTG